MEWKNLEKMKCPSCSHKISDETNSMGYACTSCEFFIGYEKFQKLINDMMMPRKPKYDPDKVDRSGWEW